MRAWIPILVLALAACGDAVTNPSLEGFEHDPRPIEGRWVTTLRLASGELQTFEADLTPAGGVFLGSFEFSRLGQVWQLQFADARWDGVRLQFTARVPVGGIPTDVDWMAVFFPAEGGEPARLLLSSNVTGGPGAAVEYVRP
jgi:hypothetical protein